MYTITVNRIKKYQILKATGGDHERSALNWTQICYRKYVLIIT